MTQAAQPTLAPGRAYRTRDLLRWGANPTRLARRLVREGKLRQAARGLLYAPIESRFAFAPAPEDEILRAFFGGSPFVATGPPRWNALGLGATAMFAATLVYTTRRTGEFTFDGRRFLLRRALFPESPPADQGERVGRDAEEEQAPAAAGLDPADGEHQGVQRQRAHEERVHGQRGGRRRGRRRAHGGPIPDPGRRCGRVVTVGRRDAFAPAPAVASSAPLESDDVR